MEKGEEIDQFQLLEEKVNSLISLVGSLREEKESLNGKIRVQEDRIADLNAEVEQLRALRENAKQRVVSLLEKMEQLEI
ncbi:MAG: cell division protein ZapB [Deltaproteobacteria bacterium]|nr:cell division protein ZapB [Deltaproteobacteria bacterium]